MPCGCEPGPAPQTYEVVAPDGTVPPDYQGLDKASAYTVAASAGTGAYVRQTATSEPVSEPVAVA